MACEPDTITAEVRPRRPPLNIAAPVLLRAARRAHRWSVFHQQEGLRRTADQSAYEAWRSQSLKQQLGSHFDTHLLRGKNVLDFGCGTGALAATLAAQFRCQSVVGIDLSTAAIQQAKSQLAGLSPELSNGLRFLVAHDDRRIHLPDESIDVICCFDVVEHIPHFDDTAAQWHRILRPGGQVWIWWSPWRGPFGHHVESLIPIPWVHLLFSPRTIFGVCAEIYDDPRFVPRIWDIDPRNGDKRPNKWRTMRSYQPFLNQLTRRRFEHQVRRCGLKITHCGVHPVAQSRIPRTAGLLTRAPLIGECFVSFFTYRLTKLF